MKLVSVSPLTISIKSTNISVAGAVVKLPTTALAGRESIAIYNDTAVTVTLYIGGSNVTTTNGYPLTSACPSIAIDMDSSVDIYGITTGGTADVRILEAK